jgi:hypothetical protein
MFVYFIPLTVNLTRNSKLEKFVHELNALWELYGSSMGALRELVAVAGILLLLPNIVYRCCCYSCVEYLPSRYVKKIYWDFLVYWTSAIFLPIFSIFQCIPPMFTLMYAVKLILHTFTYHTEHVITLG